MRSADPYPLEVVRQLWPGHPDPVLVRRPGRRPPGTTQWWILPSLGRARLLVPVGSPWAATMLNRHGGGAKRVGRSLLAAAVRTGVLNLLPVARLQVSAAEPAGTDASVASLLAQVLGREVSTGLILGTPRVNRKPVLQVFADDGSTMAFLKVGTDDFTRELVQREAANLSDVHAAELNVVKPPRVLHAGRLGDLELLLLAPLSSSQAGARQAAAPPPLEAMAEVASARGVTSERLSDSVFWKTTEDATAAMTDPGQRARLAEVVDSVARSHGSTEVVMGAWHGDWAPWNMGLSGGYVEVWDWERFTSPVPWGFDAVHYLAQRVRLDSAEVADQEQAFLRQVPDTLPTMEPHGRQQDSTLVLLCYLMTMCLRFSARTPTGDGTSGQQTSLHPRGQWALDLAERVLGAGVPGDRRTA